MALITAVTARGLVKPKNEDVLAIKNHKFRTVACLCDGHWGRQAADLACKKLVTRFPGSRTRAILELKAIQSELFRLQTVPDPPETSVLCVQVDFSGLKLRYLSYGDCRLFVVRKNKIIFTLPVFATWLGALSHRVVRHRLAVDEAAVYGSLALKTNDRIYMFTDGVDECVYGIPTITNTWLACHTAGEIFARIFRCGAEDNASLIIIKC